jgi:sulfatase maturation enzyme AslB (radical SAM superfamily)
VIRLIGGLLNGAGKKGKKEQYDHFFVFITNGSNPTAVMVFLASHVVCSGYISLQYPLLRILNDYTIENSAALKLKAQSLEQFLIQCKDTLYISTLLSQEKRIDVTEFKRLVVQIVGPSSSAAQITLLLDLVRLHGPLSSFACQQLAIVFPTTGQSTQLQIAKLLLNQLENGPSVFPRLILLHKKTNDKRVLRK